MLCVHPTELEKDLCRRLIRGVAMSVRVRLSTSCTIGLVVGAEKPLDNLLSSKPPEPRERALKSPQTLPGRLKLLGDA